MKILLVVTRTEIGGAQVFVLQLAKALKASGYDVDVAGGEGDYLLNELKKNDIDFYYINSLKRDVNILNSLYFIYDLYNFIKDRKYDIIHLNSTNTLFGALSAYFLRKKPKVVFTFHGLSFLDRNYEISRSFRFAARAYFSFLLRHIEDYVFVSKCNKNEAVRTRLADNGHVIYNGLNEKEMHFYSRQEARDILKEEYGVDLSNAFVVGSVGRLAYPKNYDFLIRNIQLFKKEIPELKFVIVGSGPKFDKYKKLIEENSCADSFFLAGAIKDSYRIVRAFDVFTLPSRFEGLSISMIEALYAEVPILASEIDGNKEVLDNDQRQFYKLDDANEYIQKLLEIKKNANALSTHNGKLKLRFTLERMSSEYINVYKALAAKK